MKLFNCIILSSLIVLITACSTPTETQEEGESALFGWNKAKTDSIKALCLEHYDAKKNRSVNKIEYCNCFVEKIIVSVKYNHFVKPNKTDVAIIDGLSKTCTRLADKGEQEE